VRWGWRRLRPGELDHEILWGSVLAACAIGGAFWLLLRIPTPKCLFHAVTGYPCTTCGATRGFRELLHGDLIGALAWNPLVLTAAFTAALYVVYAAIVVIFRTPRLRVEVTSPAVALALRIGAVTLVAANWIYLMVLFSARGL